MFTGSADHPWPDESITPVRIVDRVTRTLPPDRDPAELDPAELDLAGLDLAALDGGVLDPFDPADDTWMAEAACKGRTTLFFGNAGERPERRARRERAARGVCESCSVLIACRERARTGRENGFWGGESEEERAAAGFPPRSISRRAVQQAGTVRAAAS